MLVAFVLVEAEVVEMIELVESVAAVVAAMLRILGNHTNNSTNFVMGIRAFFLFVLLLAHHHHYFAQIVFYHICGIFVLLNKALPIVDTPFANTCTMGGRNVDDGSFFHLYLGFLLDQILL